MSRSVTRATAVAAQDWLWYGHAAHFVGGWDCHFHLATEVGGVLVSTVGEYKPDGGRDHNFKEIGSGRTYETFVFKTGPGRCECGCGLPDVPEFLEIDSEGANSAAEATRNHLLLCEKWASQ